MERKPHKTKNSEFGDRPVVELTDDATYTAEEKRAIIKNIYGEKKD